MTIRGEAPGRGSPAQATDGLADLLGRIAARDAAAFSALYKATSAKLYGVVARILPRGDAAADALQEAMCASGKRPASSTPPRAPRSRGWRPSPAIARSTRSGGFVQGRSGLARELRAGRR